MLPWRLDAATVITPLQPEGAKSMRGFVIVIAYSILFGLITAGLVLAAVVLR